MNLRRFILPIAALLLLLAPSIASAQWSSCYYFYCESFASWEPGYNQVQGYSRMEDWLWGVEMEVDGYVYDPNLEWWIYLGYSYGTWDVFVDESYSTSEPGQYYTGADNYYLWGSPGWFEYDGESVSNPAYVTFYPHPTGDFTSYHYNLNDPGRYSARFELTLTPDRGSDYDGGWVQESLWGFVDFCKVRVPGSPVTLLPPEPAGATVVGGKFEDTIGSGEPWVDYYAPLVRDWIIDPCLWQTYQTVSYEGVPYSYSVVSGQEVQGLWVESFRAGVSSTQPWRGD